MLRILDEKFLFENTKIGQSFRPENFAFILVYEGSITLEVNGNGLCFQKGNVIIISSNNLYKLIDTSLDLKIYLLSSNKETIRKYTNIPVVHLGIKKEKRLSI